MGRADTPVRRVLNYGSDHFARHLPIVYVLTVVGKDDGESWSSGGFSSVTNRNASTVPRRCRSRSISRLLDAPLRKVVVYLDPSEFKSTWLGNKSIYRTRMALADDGELIVLAPGLARFGEDDQIDRIDPQIRICRDAARSGAGPKAGGSQTESGDGGPPDSWLLGRPVHHNLLSRQPHPDRRSKRALPLCRSARDDGPIQSRDAGGRFNRLPDGEEIFYISNPAPGSLGTSKNVLN